MLGTDIARECRKTAYRAFWWVSGDEWWGLTNFFLGKKKEVQNLFSFFYQNFKQQGTYRG